ncbi:MAG: hypothetical protein K1X29_05670 [Bdellovibrionales bacterium]|nr:hypothetical protein [Bdellovibrionales bacterium]
MNGLGAQTFAGARVGGACSDVLQLSMMGERTLDLAKILTDGCRVTAKPE